MYTTVCRKEHFNAAHRVFNPNWSEEKNLKVFGKCAYPHYHGHNYELVIKLSGEVDEETGYLIDLKYVSDVCKSEVLDKLDHKNLNLDLDDFADTIPSSENLAHYIWHKLRPKFDSTLELSIVLYETPRNWVEYSGK